MASESFEVSSSDSDSSSEDNDKDSGSKLIKPDSALIANNLPLHAINWANHILNTK